MVTLRKVSLQLADHHIGITHAGDGCSRRITDFDREQAIELGEAAEAELKAAEATLKRKAELTKELPDPSKMESAPEELPAPASLGGSLLDAPAEEGEAEAVDNEGPEIIESDGPDVTITSLADRAADDKEDMDEKLEWQRAVDAAEAEEETSAAEEESGGTETPEVEEQE